MKLLSKEILSLESLDILGEMIKMQYESKDIKNSRISLVEFSLIFRYATEQIMLFLIQDIANKNEKISCKFENLPLKNRGTCAYTKNGYIITINIDVIKKIYEGNILELLTVFHELNHLLIECEILKGTINFELSRCLKERILHFLGQEELKKCKKITRYNKYFSKGFISYYYDNYKYNSEEKIVNIMAINEFLTFINYFNIKITSLEQKKIQKMLHQNKLEYKNYLRDVRKNITFNSNFVDFDEIFNITIKNYPEWLEFEILQMEYYLNEDDEVVKRSKVELMEMLLKEPTIERQEYLKILIEGDKDKKLDNTFFNPTKKCIDKFYYNKLNTKKYILKNNNKIMFKDNFNNEYF